MAWVDEFNEIQIYKTLDFDDFYTRYVETDNTYGHMSDMLIHFRIKTHGKIDIKNCHPFRINDDMVFIHNGTITDVPVCADKSDTIMFNETVLQNLSAGWEDCAGTRKLIEKFIGWSKLCVLHRDKGLILFNEQKGTWVNNVWFSNDSYKREPYKSTSSSTTSYGSGSGYGERGDWKVPITSVSSEKKVLTTRTFKQCRVCSVYHNVNRLFADPDNVNDHYCINCLEFLHAPDEMVCTENGKDITVFDLLMEDPSFTEKEVEDYVDRYTEMMEYCTESIIELKDSLDEDDEYEKLTVGLQ